MKCLIPEIFWHNRDPVLSVDIQPKPLENENKIRLASGGYDSHVLVCIDLHYCDAIRLVLNLSRVFFITI